jgi:hypothetical protein
VPVAICLGSRAQNVATLVEFYIWTPKARPVLKCRLKLESPLPACSAGSSHLIQAVDEAQPDANLQDNADAEQDQVLGACRPNGGGVLRTCRRTIPKPLPRQSTWAICYGELRVGREQNLWH